MTPTATATLDALPAELETYADAARALGVSAERIIQLLRPATEDDVVRLAERTPKRLAELVDGVLVEKPMGQREGFFAASLIAFLMAHVRANKLGVVGAPDTILRLGEGLNRLPDVCFTAWANLPAADAHLQRVGAYAPDLAIEILSPSNTPAELARKRGEYFAAGTKLVWEFDPDARTVTVYTTATAHNVLTATDTLSGGTVLPGFSLPLAELFDDPQLNPRP